MWLLVTETGDVFAENDRAAAMDEIARHCSPGLTPRHPDLAMVWDDTLDASYWFAVAVRNGDRGRKWFRCDSSAGGDRRFVLSLAWATKRDNPTLPIALVDAKTNHSYRPRTLTMAHDSLYRHEASTDDEGDSPDPDAWIEDAGY